MKHAEPFSSFSRWVVAKGRHETHSGRRKSNSLLMARRIDSKRIVFALGQLLQLGKRLEKTIRSGDVLSVLRIWWALIKSLPELEVKRVNVKRAGKSVYISFHYALKDGLDTSRCLRRTGRTSVRVQLAYRLRNHRSAVRLRSVVLSVEKFALHALRREAESQPLPFLLFTGLMRKQLTTS
jgi:hypothetical protein